MLENRGSANKGLTLDRPNVDQRRRTGHKTYVSGVANIRNGKRLLDMTVVVLFIVVLLTNYLEGVIGETRSPRVVETRLGKLRGFIRPLPNKSLRPVEVFLGVPYATPPTGSNRFSPTRSPNPWDGEREARQYGPVCPQLLPDLSSPTVPRERLVSARRLANHLTNQAEDCLYLNVYVPSQGRYSFLLSCSIIPSHFRRKYYFKTIFDVHYKKFLPSNSKNNC